MIDVILNKVGEEIQLLCQKEQVAKYSIFYSLKQCEALVFLRLLFHDEERGKMHEDEEPGPTLQDSYQCFRVPKRCRDHSQDEYLIPAQKQYESASSQQGNGEFSLITQTEFYNNSHTNTSSNNNNNNNSINNNHSSLDTNRIQLQSNSIQNKPCKERSYVRQMITKEKEKNLNYEQSLMNSINNYQMIDQKASHSFSKYVQGHSLGPLQIKQPIHPLQKMPEELILPKNVAFMKKYKQQAIDKISSSSKKEQKNIDSDNSSIQIIDEETNSLVDNLQSHKGLSQFYTPIKKFSPPSRQLLYSAEELAHVRNSSLGGHNQNIYAKKRNRSVSNTNNSQQQQSLINSTILNEKGYYLPDSQIQESLYKPNFIRQDLSQLMMERRKQQQLVQESNESNIKCSNALFAPERKISARLQVNQSQNISDIIQRPQYNQNHLKHTILPSIKVRLY